MKRSETVKKKNSVAWDIFEAFPVNPHDALPVRSHLRKPMGWETVFYAATALFWCLSLVLACMDKYGTFTALMFGIFILYLRFCIFEFKRKKRCSTSLLGKVESFTRRRWVSKKEYPVIRFEVDGQTYRAHGQKACHTSTLGNDEWVIYNPQDPEDNCVAVDAKPATALWLTLISGVISVLSLILEVLA